MGAHSVATHDVNIIKGGAKWQMARYEKFTIQQLQELLAELRIAQEQMQLTRQRQLTEQEAKLQYKKRCLQRALHAKRNLQKYLEWREAYVTTSQMTQEGPRHT